MQPVVFHENMKMLHFLNLINVGEVSLPYPSVSLFTSVQLKLRLWRSVYPLPKKRPSRKYVHQPQAETGSNFRDLFTLVSCPFSFYQIWLGLAWLGLAWLGLAWLGVESLSMSLDVNYNVNLPSSLPSFSAVCV